MRSTCPSRTTLLIRRSCSSSRRLSVAPFIMVGTTARSVRSTSSFSSRRSYTSSTDSDEVLRTDRAVEENDERSEEHTSELQSRSDLVCRLLLEKKKKKDTNHRLSDKNAPQLDGRQQSQRGHILRKPAIHP